MAYVRWTDYGLGSFAVLFGVTFVVVAVFLCRLKRSLREEESKMEEDNAALRQEMNDRLVGLSKRFTARQTVDIV